MDPKTFRTAVSVVDPTDDRHFGGSLNEAVDAMAVVAAEMRTEYGVNASTRLARLLTNAQADRVAKVAAAALLRLAEQSKPAHDTSQPTPPFPLAEGDTVTVTMPARVAGLPDPEADPGEADELWDFAIIVAGETEYVSLTQAEVIARVRKP